jgi:hypothetical protein
MLAQASSSLVTAELRRLLRSLPGATAGRQAGTVLSPGVRPAAWWSTAMRPRAESVHLCGGIDVPNRLMPQIPWRPRLLAHDLQLRQEGPGAAASSWTGTSVSRGCWRPDPDVRHAAGRTMPGRVTIAGVPLLRIAARRPCRKTPDRRWREYCPGCVVAIPLRERSGTILSTKIAESWL